MKKEIVAFGKITGTKKTVLTKEGLKFYDISKPVLVKQAKDGDARKMDYSS